MISLGCSVETYSGIFWSVLDKVNYLLLLFLTLFIESSPNLSFSSSVLYIYCWNLVYWLEHNFASDLKCVHCKYFRRHVRKVQDITSALSNQFSANDNCKWWWCEACLKGSPTLKLDSPLLRRSTKSQTLGSGCGLTLVSIFSVRISPYWNVSPDEWL